MDTLFKLSHSLTFNYKMSASFNMTSDIEPHELYRFESKDGVLCVVHFELNQDGTEHIISISNFKDSKFYIPPVNVSDEVPCHSNNIGHCDYDLKDDIVEMYDDGHSNFDHNSKQDNQSCDVPGNDVIELYDHHNYSFSKKDKVDGKFYKNEIFKQLNEYSSGLHKIIYNKR